MKKSKFVNTDINNPEFRKKFTARLSGLFETYKKENNCSDAYLYETVLGIGKTTYYNWKNPDKETFPSFENLIDLHNLFGMPIDYIMCVSDEKSRPHIETDLSIKKMCDLTNLNKSAVLTLCDSSTISMNIKTILNYLLDAPPEIQRTLKAILVKDNSIKNNLLSDDEIKQLSDSDKKAYYKRMNKLDSERNRLLFAHNQLTNKQKKPYLNKVKFINYLYNYIFTRLEHTFTYLSDDDMKGVEINNLVFLDETLLVAQTMKTNASDFEKLFLDNAVYYLNKIKDYYLENDFDKEILAKQKMDALMDEINAEFHGS